MTINSIKPFSSVSSVNFKQQLLPKEATQNSLPNDKIDLSEKTKQLEPPQISRTRLFFGRLTDEQIKQINEAKKLPENAKFVMNGFGGYVITNNFFNFRAGTRDLPAGFEVKKDIFGFTVVLPKGMEGISVKSV